MIGWSWQKIKGRILKNKMKICICSTTFLPKIGGAEIVIHHLAKNLQKLGHQVTVLVPFKRKDFNNKKLPYSLHKLVLFSRFKQGHRWIENMIKTNLFIEYLRTRFDILHIHIAYPAGYAALTIKKIIHKPLVITCHGNDVQKMPEIFYGLRLNPQIEQKIRETLKLADAITSISSSIKNDIIDAGGSSSKIYDIANGVAFSIFRDVNPGNIRKEYNISESSKLIIAVGRNHPKKGYKYLIEAMSIIAKEVPLVKCIIVGDGTESLKPLIDRLGLNKFITLSGRIPAKDTIIDVENLPHVDLIRLYKTSDIFVSPAIIEGLSLVSLEAMAAGLPIVATDVPGNQDIIQHGNNGYLVEKNSPIALAEGIKNILSDENLKEKMANASFKIAEKYSWENISKQYLRLYETII